MHQPRQKIPIEGITFVYGRTMDFEKKIELASAFVDGEMDEAQRREFVHSMAEDEELSELVHQMRLLRHEFAIEQQKEPPEDLADRLEPIILKEAREHLQRIRPAKRGFWQVLSWLLSPEAAAAITLVIVLLGSYMLIRPESTKPTRSKTPAATAVAKKAKSAIKRAKKENAYVNQMFSGKGEPIEATVITQEELADSISANKLILNQNQTSRSKRTITPQTMLTTNPGESLILSLDSLHILGLYPSSVIKVARNANGACLINVIKGGVIVADLDRERSKALAKKESAKVSINQVAVLMNAFLIEPVGTVFTVRELYTGDYIKVAVRSGRVRILDANLGKALSEIPAGFEARIYKPQGSINKRTSELDPLTEFKNSSKAMQKPTPTRTKKSANSDANCNPAKPEHIPAAETPEAARRLRMQAEQTQKKVEMPAPMLKRFYDKMRQMMAKNRWKEAAEYLENFIDKYSGKQVQEAYYLLGICYEKQGDYERARIAYKSYLNAFEGGKRRKDVLRRLKNLPESKP